MKPANQAAMKNPPTHGRSAALWWNLPMTHAIVASAIGMPAYATLRSSEAPKIAIAARPQKNGNDRSLPAWFETAAKAAISANVAVGAPSGNRWRKNRTGAARTENGMIASL